MLGLRIVPVVADQQKRRLQSGAGVSVTVSVAVDVESTGQTKSVFERLMDCMAGSTGVKCSKSITKSAPTNHTQSAPTISINIPTGHRRLQHREHVLPSAEVFVSDSYSDSPRSYILHA